MVKIRKISIKKGSKIPKKKKALSGKTKNMKRIEFSPKELKVNIEQLHKDVRRAYGSMMKLLPESVKDAEIKKFGNASHIILPKNYAGKKATVIIKR